MSSKEKTIGMKEGGIPTLVPKLRFPKFREAEGWKPVTLGEVSTPVTERIRQRKLTPVSISAGIGFVPQAEKFGRDISGNQYQLYTLVRDGDFVYNKGNSLKFPQGCVYQLQGWGQVAAPNVFICFRLNNGYSDSFFQNCFEQNLHGKQLKRHITSGARSNGLLNISKENFFGIEIPTPSFPEQQKIADCLTSLDEAIAAQARKVDALKKHKKGLMQQLFPREGGTQPRRRFSEFQITGNWHKKTVGEISDVQMCKRIFAEETNSLGGVPFYKIGTLGANPDAFISREKFEEYKSKYKYPKKGEVLITCSGTVGKCIAFDGKDAYFQDSNIVWLDNPSGEVSNEFLLMLLSNMNWSGLNSTTITRIYGPDLRGLAIRFPENEAEQKRIAECLTSLDTLITAEHQKLDMLKNHKKGLTQQLFPSRAEDNA